MKYYHISYRIIISGSTDVYAQEVIDKSPLDFVLEWKEIGGHYGERVILYSEEITKEDYERAKEFLND